MKTRWLEALRQGAVDPDHAARLHGGKGGGGSAPDYRGAAEAEGAASKELANQQTWANRPTINTPWGSESWTAGTAIDPATGQPVTSWTSNISLSPEEQAALDAQQRIQQGRSQAAETLLGQATDAFSTPFNWDSLPSVPGSLEDAQRSAYEKMSATLEPGRARQRGALDTKLANMGLAMGTEAHRRAQGDLGDQFNTQDQMLLSQAMQEGRADLGTQQTLRNSAIAEEAQRRGMTLNELNALLTGQQVNMPQFPGFSQAGAGQAPDYTGAAGMEGQFAQNAAAMKGQAQANTGAAIGTIGMIAMMA